MGHSNGGAGPRRAEGVREGVTPPATRVRGCHPRENFEREIANAKYCILVHFQLCPRDVRPWMESMRSLTFAGSERITSKNWSLRRTGLEPKKLNISMFVVS